MTGLQQDIYEEISNPLDCVEEIMAGRDWSFDRLTPDELVVQVAGNLGCYNITLIWQEDYSALQFFCELDMAIPKERMDMTGRTLLEINEKLWLGHFDVPQSSGIPCFRHTTLFRGQTSISGVDHVRDLVEIGIAECERYHNAFNMLSCALYLDDELLDLALTDSAGRA